MDRQTEKILIKNMVCPRCIRVVREDLNALGLPLETVSMGEALMSRPLRPEEKTAMGKVLAENGFEVLSSREEQLVEQVKNLIIEHIWERKPKPSNLNFSDYLAQAMHTNYFALSKLFSALTSTTVEQFIIQQKIERVKELLTYGEETLTEIAYRLEYSSPQHLSNQFKKVTGLNPSQFRQNVEQRRKALRQLEK